jgi:hypothetical protein
MMTIPELAKEIIDQFVRHVGGVEGRNRYQNVASLIEKLSGLSDDMRTALSNELWSYQIPASASTPVAPAGATSVSASSQSWYPAVEMLVAVAPYAQKPAANRTPVIVSSAIGATVGALLGGVVGRATKSCKIPR